MRGIICKLYETPWRNNQQVPIYLYAFDRRITSPGSERCPQLSSGELTFAMNMRLLKPLYVKITTHLMDSAAKGL